MAFATGCRTVTEYRCAASQDRRGKLKGMGNGQPMDDCGTGHSPLIHLKRLPIDPVKLTGMQRHEHSPTQFILPDVSTHL
jgi:predicted signal transduction protein with EAL and GGDEF domain